MFSHNFTFFIRKRGIFFSTELLFFVDSNKKGLIFPNRYFKSLDLQLFSNDILFLTTFTANNRVAHNLVVIVTLIPTKIT